jgi:transposase-like protein
MQPQNYCGIIMVDGKYISVKRKKLVEIAFIDYLTHDIPVHIDAISENMIDIEKGFQILKETGYPLIAVVCDESMGEIAKVAKKVFPQVKIQLCLTHYSRNVDRVFKVNFVRKKIKSLEKKLKKIGNSILTPTHHSGIEKARQAVNEIADLEFEYGYLIEVQRIFRKIFWSIKTKEERDELEDMLNMTIARMNLDRYPHASRIKKRYLDYYEKREELTAFTRYPELDIPRTTNLIEGFNSTTLEMRLSSIRGFEKLENAHHYLNALILKRRFQKFTDCKGKFKHLNGKSPLEIAKPLNTFTYNFSSRDWINFCRKLKS